MHLLIAGHGFLGQAVSLQARAQGWQVTTLTRSGEQADRACDLTDIVALRRLADEVQPTHILACASSGRGGTESYRNVFLNGTSNIIKTFPKAHLTFVSSTSVYRQIDGSTVDESSETNGATEKSEILLAAETETLNREGTVLRLSGIYGEKRSVILKRFLAGESTLEETPHGLGVRIINQIYVQDAARAIIHLIMNHHYGLFNVSDDEPTSQRETFIQLAEKLDLPMPSAAPPKETKRGWTHKAVSNEKLRATGWAPIFPSFLSAVETLIPTIEIR